MVPSVRCGDILTSSSSSTGSVDEGGMICSVVFGPSSFDAGGALSVTGFELPGA